MITLSAMDFAYILSVFVLLIATSLAQDPTASAVDFELHVTPNEPITKLKVNESRSFSCYTSNLPGGQKPTLTWSKDGQELTSTLPKDRIRVENIGGRYVLTIGRIEDGDEGIFTCTATLGSAPPQSKKIKTVVYQEIRVHSEKHQYPMKGDIGRIECDATAKPLPVLEWQFENGTKIVNSDRYVIGDKYLEIKNINEDDDGIYTCSIIVWSTGERVNFDIQVEVAVYPVISRPPSFTPNSPVEGDTVEIHCTAEGKPKPTYAFYKGDIQIEEAKVNKVNGILTLENLQQSDEGQYKCRACNIKTHCAEELVMLDVFIKPTVDDIAEVLGVQDEEQVLHCVAHGDPKPTVVWRKTGTTYDYLDTASSTLDPVIVTVFDDSPDDAEIKTVKVDLKFTKLQPQHAGDYSCIATNSAGHMEKQGTVKVKFVPHFNNQYRDNVLFYGWNGHTANMTCVADGIPTPIIKWYRDDVKNPGTAVEIKNDFTYSIRKNDNDEQAISYLLVEAGNDASVYGDYNCTAENAQGKNTKVLTLMKATEPSDPVVKVRSRLSFSVKLEIQVPSDEGGQEVTKYKYNYYAEGKSEEAQGGEIDRNMGGDTQLSLTKLKPHTKYVIHIHAVNKVGEGKAAVLTAITPDYSEPERIIITSPSEGTNPDSYYIKWAKPIDGGKDIETFYIKYQEVEVNKDKDVVRTIGKLHEVSIPGKSKDYTITGLKRDTYYKIDVQAENDEGRSISSPYTIKTSAGVSSVHGSTGPIVRGTLATVPIALACSLALW